jgi:hypothetical protein
MYMSTSKSKSNHRVAAVAAGAAILVSLGSFGAVAAGMITGKDIKDGSIRQADIGRNAVGSGEIEAGAVRLSDLSDGAERGLQGEQGPKGDKGDKGEKGEAGPPGTASYTGANWSIVDRNVTGNGDAYLRSGPSSLGDVKPPIGIGSLGLRTGSSADKAAFGNQVDFAGLLVKDITKIGFSIFNTGENMGADGGNVPSIVLEIDPNVSTVDSNYSSLVYVPAEDTSAANHWRTYDATTEGRWGLTGSKFAGTDCDINSSRCSWTELKAYLNDGGEDAVVTYSVQITKGRDYAFSGAVDALVINDATYDFEPFGVTKR